MKYHPLPQITMTLLMRRLIVVVAPLRKKVRNAKKVMTMIKIVRVALVVQKRNLNVQMMKRWKSKYLILTKNLVIAKRRRRRKEKVLNNTRKQI